MGSLARPLAAITTATVDVQVLRIGTKQMTLAVFRQLHRDEALDGPMWGTVNYCHRLFAWPCDPQHPEHHQHIVWQDGNDLRHAIRRTLEGMADEHSNYCFEIARRFGRHVDAQRILDHAATFTVPELRAIEKKLGTTHYSSDYSMTRWAERFLEFGGGRWRAVYDRLEEEERPFRTLPQLFIAV